VRNFVGNSSNTESAGSGSTGTDAPDSLADSTPAPDAGTPTESESETVAGVALNDRSEPAETAPAPAGEDAAQASARSDIVSPDELPDTDASEPPAEGQVVQEPDDEADRPDLSELREELNDQFESIKVLEPGQYELNLMELYDREEYIIALQEDGKYSIQVPDRWQD
jgi:predicted  nucleic acid-binding Zn-ribbon protein